MKFAHNGANFDGEFPTLDKNSPLENGSPNLRVMCVERCSKMVLTYTYGLEAQYCVKELIFK